MRKHICFVLFLFIILLEGDEGEKETKETEEDHSGSIKIYQRDKTESIAKGMGITSQIMIFCRQNLLRLF